MVTASSPITSAIATRRIALAGNPNAGKTTLFNALTGMRQKVGNYPGVTVEKKEGRCQLNRHLEAVLLDLPGTYSLSPKSPDEEIARDVLLGLREDTPIPDAVVVVLDASNLERNLYLATQVLELGLPTVVALNMTDVAESNGKPVDAQRLSEELGAPVVPLTALRGIGIPELRSALERAVQAPTPPPLQLAESLAQSQLRLAATVGTYLPEPKDGNRARGVALRLLCSAVPDEVIDDHFGPAVAESLRAEREALGLSPAACGAAEAQARYAMLGQIANRVVRQPTRELPQSFTDRADAILTHKLWGLLIFALITLLVFQAIYSWADYPMSAIDIGIKQLGNWVQNHMTEGPLRELVVSGVISGVGAVIIFLPQILILFLFIGLLEDSGYMARAAFLMDRLMSRVGLHGRAFIPLLSSFACAIPGIMATRTISSRRDRMTTILIAPLMSCSARLPVYTLMIGAFIPNHKVLGFLSLRAVVMFSMYVLGVATAMLVAWLLKKTLFKGPPPPLMLELPPYKIPAWRNVVVTMWERASQFLQRAGTVILAISIVLWFLLSYPRVPASAVAPPIGLPSARSAQNVEDKEHAIEAATYQHSYAGRIGHFIEPVIAPLGFNWKIGIGLIGAMSAREVFVSTLGTVYSVGDTDENAQTLREAMRQDRWPDGRPVWTTLVAISVLVYFVLAMQCMSTLAVVRRETNSWGWPLFMWGYMTGLAYIASLIVYQGGRMLGL